ncbi:phosphoribosylformylglycinamidine synthase subunit PurL [Jonesia denitrificans]|uniref:Phosphoribosylformylglycinamidine synthase subunit PurL n=1 Tax=Jonesia denitrificans (strain ATCC 14870 / DSM 20603 / BCRC 15368 / CIP 55.134 / JCM 11481 / NBRC 15587 / NCTC 10816 / Prevot 55134) TaxID=471856 RepID=C7R2K7_JONDD|nr:phosphoribosylformylglycinamidine synthase subunit PurL [Jonesia denitrificans]ACV09998.1 phosphoribosylformylglycinamidine synthase II [Jonesia denitrificans DSM 20603]ASE08767.1 phosphoribosylformylglycinamidine synthase subunit PurL [Jonesia denitrificans]QXB43372.1 phosphoribosylformylglycinamidine synthase subunit PurL [Jonesia denitrificans]SQH22776.1 Phosphoribosylformylglycinamidine synthase 2 [Jonesia denitrificans]
MTASSTPTPDTVDHAANTPDEEQPYASLGLKDDEYQRIRDILGRRPTAAELAMYSVMWSEHCSYKSSKVHLRTFGDKTTPEMTKNLLVGIGENAGVVDIGDGWAVTFKVESHNHPSYVEPYQGAATGVGGIVRDIISMGARPVAVMDQLRFGDVNHPDTARVVHGVVAGVGGYGNSLGLPNIGGELVFDSCYQGNPLVNALAVGVLRHEDIHLANASGVGNKVVLFGARTGGDGIGGASILASETFEDGVPTKRPSVQVGDPFMEKVLIECCLELFHAGVVEGIQDLGAAGISCATSELASNGDGGMHVWLDDVLLRDPTLTAGEILMSESQERMMAVVRPDKLDEFLAITTKWDVESSVVGEVNDSGRLTIDHHGHRIVDVDPRTVAHEGPVYHRPYARPAWQDALNRNTTVAAGLARPSTADELRATALQLLGSPNLCSKEWVTNQYDRYVQGNTALSQPDDAGVIRVDESTNLGVAIATDANGRYGKLDPRTGAQLALAEAYRNVAAAGARPMAITDCLNFGSPEDPDSMWQLVEAIEGLADACMELTVPVTGGNVSLYNGTGEPGNIDSSIHPTPVVGVLGVIDDVRHSVTSGWRNEGDAIYLLGTTRDELDGSAWADVIHGHLGGVPPLVNLPAERALGAVLVTAARDSLVSAAHDLSEGGLIQGLLESCLRYGVGARVDITPIVERDSISQFAALFSESTARVLVAVPREDEVRFVDSLVGRSVPHARIGEVGHDDNGEAALAVDGLFSIALSEARDIHTATLPTLFG